MSELTSDEIFRIARRNMKRFVLARQIEYVRETGDEPQLRALAKQFLEVGEIDELNQLIGTEFIPDPKEEP